MSRRHSHFGRFGRAPWLPLFVVAQLAAIGCATDGSKTETEQVATQSSELVVPGGRSDTLAEYSAKCDIATGIHVPAFNCDLGTEIPGQGTVPNGTSCAEPNVLYGRCDPGSKFQILPGGTADAVAVAHCRKKGSAAIDSTYGDIAVIQYNKKNGAVCFYQALGTLNGVGTLNGAAVASPARGETAWSWQTPKVTEGQACTGCHDNGGFIRSKYIAQFIPSTAAGYDNLNTPAHYVGADFATNRTWSVSTTNAVGDIGVPCNGCHRLAVSNTIVAGTAGDYALRATAATQTSKIAHTSANPIWMRPNQIEYGTCKTHSTLLCNDSTTCPGHEPCVSTGADATAAKYAACANGFWSGKSPGFVDGTPTAGCTFTPLGTPWTGFSPVQAVSAAASIQL